MHRSRKYSRCKLGCWNRRSCLWSCRQFIPFSITIRSLFLRSNTFQSLTLLLAPQMQTLSIVFHPIQLSCNCYFNRHWRTKIAHSIEMVVQWSPFTFVCTSVLGSPQCCSSYLKSYILKPELDLAIQWHCYNPVCQHHYAYSQPVNDHSLISSSYPVSLSWYLKLEGHCAPLLNKGNIKKFLLN